MATWQFWTLFIVNTALLGCIAYTCDLMARILQVIEIHTRRS